MRKDTRKVATDVVRNVVAIDLGDETSEVRVFEAESGSVAERRQVRTRRTAMERLFGRVAPGSRVVLEAGTHSPWVARLAQAAGHEVVVANPRRVAALYRTQRKSDAHDTDLLLDLGRVRPELLRPIRHRSEPTQRHLAVVRMRDANVQARTALVCAVRGSVKSLGERLASCSAESFARNAWRELAPELRRIFHDTLLAIARLTRTIRRYEREMRRIAKEHYPVVEQLMQVPGVGEVTALAFVLVIEDPSRFRKSRDVGPYVGLVPRLDQSGTIDPQLGISKEGDPLVRRLLVQCAQHVLGHRGADTDLRRWGLSRAERGGKNAKKRAVCGVARRIAVLLHSLWVTGEVYEPLRNARLAKQRAA